MTHDFRRAWRLPFGTHKGALLRDVPTDYLRWLTRQKLSGKLAEAVAREVARRGLTDALRPAAEQPAPQPTLPGLGLGLLKGGDLPALGNFRGLKNDPCNCDLYCPDGQPADEPFTDDAGVRWVRCRLCGKVWRRLDRGDPGADSAGTGGRGPYFKKGGGG